jgi:hypothetical protein
MYLTHGCPYRSKLNVSLKADTNFFSHFAMIHVPPLPLYDETNFVVKLYLLVQGTFDWDYTRPKDSFIIGKLHIV